MTDPKSPSRLDRGTDQLCELLAPEINQDQYQRLCKHLHTLHQKIDRAMEQRDEAQAVLRLEQAEVTRLRAGQTKYQMRWADYAVELNNVSDIVRAYRESKINAYEALIAIERITEKKPSDESRSASAHD